MKYLLMVLLLYISSNAQEIAFVKSVNGTVFAKKSKKTLELKQGDRLETGMVIITKENSNITIIFDDTSNLVLGSNSFMDLEKFVFKPAKREYDFQLSIKKGTLSFESGKIGEMAPEAFILKTPEGVVAIRGTKFFVKVQ